MVSFSKFQTIPTSCAEFVHPWTESCSTAITGIGIHALQESFRIYVTVYMLASIMRGRVPSQKEIKQTLVGIIISSIFLGTNAFAFPLFACWLRKLFGHFNVLSVGFLPAFLASYVAILLERPSRRGLLALYVTNVATETLFRMAAWRGLVRPVPYGQVLIFSASIAALLYVYRGHQTKRDSVYSLLRFVVGPYEENGYVENRADLPSMADARELQSSGDGDKIKRPGGTSKGLIHIVPTACCRIYRRLLMAIQGLSRHTVCPHPFSCAYYTLQLMSCLLRRVFNRDSKFYAIPSGLLAGLAFGFFPDNTVALYVMWKSLQVIYSDSIQKGYVPQLPGGTILLYSFSTAILFHAGVLEPQNLRPSYWKFLHSLSGARIAVMDRKSLDAFGMDTSKALLEVLAKTNTYLVPYSEL
ncbi:hypothetical protein Cfor_12887 [Coptotermes formosanus]|uniref:Transmembrane protein 135 N-terminal domain-containing protein n=1 Tax=Coptotermes formosanus TaxID=36987 RepID=A0A6L2PMQ5_COPFO|nr:hypothetical protein Cfor_12887 [Coptotermes formosanus]